MKRVVFVVVLALLASCIKKQRKGFGQHLSEMRDRIAAAVKIKATVDANALAAPPPPAATRVDRAEPPPSRPAPTPTPAPTPAPSQQPPDIQVNRVDASRPTVFVLRGQTHGGKDFCETHTTMNDCNSACTSMLRANALVKPTPESPKGCACHEQDRGC